jgi:hypothetical protein
MSFKVLLPQMLDLRFCLFVDFLLVQRVAVLTAVGANAICLAVGHHDNITSAKKQ